MSTATNRFYDSPLPSRLLTPEDAKGLLDTCDEVPFFSKRTIAALKNEIMIGLWRTPSHRVVLFPDGSVAAGHEFLSAIIEAGVPAKVHVEQAQEPAPKPAQDSFRLTAASIVPSLDADARSIVFETITPEIASRYLQANKGNRPIRPSAVTQYARDMAAGNWRASHQGIAFDREGTMIDGQHRMLAVIEADVPVRMAVGRNFETEDGCSVDIGKVRNEKNVAHFLGMDIGVEGTACARAMMLFRFDSSTSKREVVETAAAYREAIDFALETGKGVGDLAPVRGVLARAYIARPEARCEIARFAGVLNDDPHQPGDEGAVALRKYIRGEKKKYLRSPSARKALYKKTESALAAFLDRRKVKQTSSVAAELFPLPGEEG